MCQIVLPMKGDHVPEVDLGYCCEERTMPT